MAEDQKSAPVKVTRDPAGINADSLSATIKMTDGTKVTVDTFHSDSFGGEIKTEKNGKNHRTVGHTSDRSGALSDDIRDVKDGNHSFARAENQAVFVEEVMSNAKGHKVYTTAAVAHAMNDAIERALKDGKFTQNEAKQFQNAQNLINGAIQDHKLDAHDAQIVIKVLDKIAPEKGNGR